MYLLRDNPVKAPNGAICRLATTSTAVCIAVAGAAVLLAGAATRTQCPALPSGASSPTIPCRYDAALTRLFTPRAAPDGTYRVYVTSAPLDKVAAQLRGSDTDGGATRWAVQEMDPLDAFGSAGPYDETQVARLYVGRRARVARGPVIENGRVASSIWLISPYPDPSLARLEAGTLIIEFRVPH